MSLQEYQRKRDFRKTPEPDAGAGKRHSGVRFVVQKHDASHLHYDFRLEHDGVLKSWAVPKGPSLDPEVKTLAVQVEDHPIDYADFEGIIPQGEYGGGTVIVWDRGTWEPVGDPEEGLRKGKLKFHLHGEKLKGEWNLVRMRWRENSNRENWLLFKHRDKAARKQKRYNIVEEEPQSVISGRTIEQTAKAKARVWRSNRAGPPSKFIEARGESNRAGTPHAEEIDVEL